MIDPKDHSGAIRIGMIHTTADDATGQQVEIERRIEQWCTNFRKLRANVARVSAGETRKVDLLILIAPAPQSLRSLVEQSGRTPSFVVTMQDDVALADDAVAAGASDYLAIEATNAILFERAVLFTLQRQRTLESVQACEHALAAANERERQQLAVDLHDGPLQELIGARFLVGALLSNESGAEIQKSLQVVIQAVRSLCSEMKPPALAPFGLEKSIRVHMQSFQNELPALTVTLELESDSQSLPEWARLAFFRVYQEAVANVARHANASHLQVRMWAQGEQLRMTIADDGQGFELPKQWLDFAQQERYGLLSMQERMDALQGRIMVQSTPGNGTRVQVHAPLQQPLLPLPSYFVTASTDGK